MIVNAFIRSKISRILGKMFVSVLYETRVGIKCLNQIISSDIFECLVVENSERIITANNLYLAFDGLKDRYSLIDTPLLEAPHFSLVKSISSGEDIRATEYASRRNNGTLDFLGSVSVSNKYINYICQKFSEKERLVESGKYAPIKVISINGKYYIADGKHTAATCALLGVSPKCVDITPVVFDSFFCWVHRKMGTHAVAYKKHMLWFNNAKTVYKI